MGGYGSGRWGTSKPDARPTVESCLALDMKLLVRAGVIRPVVHQHGTWEWRNDWQDVEPRSSLGFDVRTEADRGTIGLRYSVPAIGPGGEETRASVCGVIGLVSTLLPSGGRFWYFLCPARRMDAPDPCRRRVGRLFLPRSGRVFACRHCYGLAYESNRESHRGSRFWDSLGASCRMSGRAARASISTQARKDRRWKAEIGQKAVFQEPAEVVA